MNRFLRISLYTLYWISVAGLLWSSLRPTSEGMQSVLKSQWIIRPDYLLHALAFFVLTAIAYLSSLNGNQKRHWVLLLSTTVILAVGTEYLQLIAPSRTFNPIDIISNLIGIAVALGFIRLLLFLRGKN